MRSRAILSFIFLSSLVLLFASGCGSLSGYPSDVDEALKAAGDNRAELETVLAHYKAGGDSLKFQAACFLIGNMEGHCYVTYMFVDTAGEEVTLNALEFDDYDSLLAACSRIEQERGELDYERNTRVDDLETIRADFLIDQIDLAFRAWREKPWAEKVSFENFCEYILPYRGSNEPLEPWRKVFWEKYDGIEAKLSDPGDPVEAASLINDDITTWFKFDRRYYFHPTDQGVTEMLESGMGRCEDMTNLTIYGMRANGLAVTSDYTPYWADAGNNHAWNSILTAEGKVIPFMGAEANPGEYTLHYKAAKIYRKTFGRRKENLTFQKNKQEEIPRWLAGKSFVDVTTDYLTTADPVIKFTQQTPDSVDIAYLCVFNSGQWKAIDWARIAGGTAAFSDMGTGVAYLPALYLNEEIVPCGSPFILRDDGTMDLLVADTNATGTVALTSTTEVEQNLSTDGVARTSLKPGQSYELFYWNNGWQSLGEAVATKRPLQFKKVPANGLYWLVVDDSDREERIFSFDDGQQIWW